MASTGASSSSPGDGIPPSASSGSLDAAAREAALADALAPEMMRVQLADARHAADAGGAEAREEETAAAALFRAVVDGDALVYWSWWIAPEVEPRRYDTRFFVAHVDREVSASHDDYETIEYVGPARMIDLRKKREPREPDKRLAGARILVVDDDLGICRSLQEILSAEGCVVETANDGAGALERLGEASFDTILLDINMPGLDGWETLRLIRSDPALERIPVILFSVKGETHDKVHGMQCGAVDYITKPFVMDRFLFRIAKILERSADRGLAPRTVGGGP